MNTNQNTTTAPTTKRVTPATGKHVKKNAAITKYDNVNAVSAGTNSSDK